MIILPIDIPEYYKKEKIYNWGGIYYYNNIPCSEVNKIIEGDVIDYYGDRAGSFQIHSTGYIVGNTICGNVFLKINE